MIHRNAPGAISAMALTVTPVRPPDWRFIRGVLQLLTPRFLLGDSRYSGAFCARGARRARGNGRNVDQLLHVVKVIVHSVHSLLCITQVFQHNDLR